MTKAPTEADFMNYLADENKDQPCPGCGASPGKRVNGQQITTHLKDCPFMAWFSAKAGTDVE